jgi:hypothetical protein
MSAFLLQFWPYLLGAAALAFGALKVRQSGVNAERAKQAQAEAKARDVADAVDNDLSTLTPAQARERLQQWSKQ